MRQCEVEIAKRGLMLHDIGYGWACKPLGFPANNATNTYDVSGYTDEQTQVLAMRVGEHIARGRGAPRSESKITMLAGGKHTLIYNIRPYIHRM